MLTLINKLNPSTLGSRNKDYQNSLFTEAYSTFVKYLKDKEIECFEKINEDNNNPSIGKIVKIPNYHTGFHYIYCYIYQQKEKDIIQLFSDMLNINLYQLNYVRSAERFVNKIYGNEVSLGESHLSNIEIFFEQEYIKILFTNNDFILFIGNNTVEITNGADNVKFDITDVNNIQNFIDKYVHRIFSKLIHVMKLIISKDNLNAKFICDRFNKSLAIIYSETSFNGFQLHCLERFANVNALSNKVENGPLEAQSYKTESHPEFVSLVNGYFSKSWAEQLNQLVNLFYFMSVVENKKLSFKITIRGNSKYQQQFTDPSPLVLIINYNNKDLKIQFNHSGHLFYFYDFYNVNDIDYEDHETLSGKDLNPIYMKTLDHFRQRILSECGSDDMTINEDVLNVYKMMIF